MKHQCAVFLTYGVIKSTYRRYSQAHSGGTDLKCITYTNARFQK